MLLAGGSVVSRFLRALGREAGYVVVVAGVGPGGLRFGGGRRVSRGFARG